jgi:hypothetical protein
MVSVVRHVSADDVVVLEYITVERDVTGRQLYVPIVEIRCLRHLMEDALN